MSSKSVLILGIVFIFLLNVVAVHNYIDNYYYQPDKIIKNKAEKLPPFIKNIYDFISQKKREFFPSKNKTNETKIDLQENKIDLSTLQSTEPEEKKEEPSKRLELNDTITTNDKTDQESLVEYKSSYYNQKKTQESDMDELKELAKELNQTPKEEEIKTEEKTKKEVKETKKTQTSTKENKKKQAKKETKKPTKKIEADESEKTALITLNLNINDPYEKDNPIIKKIANRLDDKKVIKIKIYKYSMKIKDYLEAIKSSFAEHGVDVDDIKVIYKKDENKKDKIKILLTKKD